MPKDFKRQFSSVEELEALLDEEFQETEEQEEESVNDSEETEQEENTDEQTEQETEDEADEESEQQADTEIVDDDGEVEVEEDVVPATTKLRPTKEEKEAYKFKQLREEKKALEQEQKQLEELARSYGYATHNDFIEALKLQKIKEEADKKNIPYDDYKRVYDLEDKVRKLEREKVESEKARQGYALQEALTKVSKSEGLTIDETESIVIALEKDGYTYDELLSIKNPEKLFRGYATDLIVEKRAKKVATKITKLKESSSKPHTNQTTPPAKTIDELVDEDLKKYAKERGLNYR